ncbi:DUF1667 domain-containing protein [Candidatus Omnitrophota bacterium]
MNKRMICTECPKGCKLNVTIQDEKVVSITGNECEKGLAYAHAEIENPMRLLTSTVRAEGLALKMVPVRTDKPIPQTKLFEGMKCIQEITIKKPLKAGEIIYANFLGCKVNLIATRNVK